MRDRALRLGLRVGAALAHLRARLALGMRRSSSRRAVCMAPTALGEMGGARRGEEQFGTMDAWLEGESKWEKGTRHISGLERAAVARREIEGERGEKRNTVDTLTHANSTLELGETKYALCDFCNDLFELRLSYMHVCYAW